MTLHEVEENYIENCLWIHLLKFVLIKLHTNILIYVHVSLLICSLINNVIDLGCSKNAIRSQELIMYCMLYLNRTPKLIMYCMLHLIRTQELIMYCMLYLNRTHRILPHQMRPLCHLHVWKRYILASLPLYPRRQRQLHVQSNRAHTPVLKLDVLAALQWGQYLTQPWSLATITLTIWIKHQPRNHLNIRPHVELALIALWNKCT